MDDVQDLKEIISQRIISFQKSNSESKKNEKYSLKDFKEIKVNKISNNLTIFYHSMYKEVSFS